ncbi:MAG: CAP domain-containing protein [Prolixibacteraceae bacterium]|jgi:uncharacterized protein YkwD|nr:CAP domain-containing protein [Prolixibacteraceae bacterium]
MKKIIFLLLLINAFHYGFGQTSAWGEILYNKYDHTNYTSYRYFSDTINPSSVDYALLNAAVFFETNRLRVKYGLKPLKHHPKLEMSAQGHSKDMVDYNFFAHTSRVPGKYSVSDRVKKAGLNESYVGENIYDHSILNFKGGAYYPPSQCGFFKSAVSNKPILFFSYRSLAEKLVKGWMDSPMHRANILKSNYTHMGMGNFIYYNGVSIDRIPYIRSTQNFARIEKTSASSSNRNRNAYYTRNKSAKPTTFCLTAGLAGVFGSIDNLANANGHYQALLYMGVLKGRKGYGQNFYGMFSSLGLGNKNPLTIEGGIILRRFFRLSAGFQYGSNTNTYTQEYRLVPSVTSGVRVNISNVFIDLNLNAYGSFQHPETRIISAIGLWF